MKSRFFYHCRHSPSSVATTWKNLALLIPEIFYACENVCMHLYFIQDIHTRYYRCRFIISLKPRLRAVSEYVLSQKSAFIRNSIKHLAAEMAFRRARLSPFKCFGGFMIYSL